jgi:hypothetical protein
LNFIEFKIKTLIYSRFILNVSTKVISMSELNNCKDYSILHCMCIVSGASEFHTEAGFPGETATTTSRQQQSHRAQASGKTRHEKGAVKFLSNSYTSLFCITHMRAIDEANI